MSHVIRKRLSIGLAFWLLSAVTLSAAFAQPPEPEPSMTGDELEAAVGDILGEEGADSTLGDMGGAPGGDVAVSAVFTAPAQDKPACLFVTAKMKPGWHIYSITQPEGSVIRTKIKVNPPAGVKFAGKFHASAKPFRKKEPAFDNQIVETHEGSITWWAPLKIDPNVDLKTLKIKGSVFAQACTNTSCLQPEDYYFTAKLGKAPVDITTVAAAHSADEKSLGTVIGFAFLGGLILNLMPCVLPVISLKLLSFLEQAGESRARVFTLNLWYAVGLLSVFFVLATLAATAGLAWGEQFSLPWFKVTMTAVVFVMALSFLGVWEIPIPGFVGSGTASKLQTKEGVEGAFLKGAFATVLATPCSGPFLGPVFGYLLNQPPQMAYVVFGSIGLGMASPYIVIGAFPKLIGFLPKAGAWMDTFKQIMGFLLLGTVVYLFWTMSAPYFVPTFALLVGLWFACWLIGRTPLTATAGKRWAARIVGIGTAAAIGVLAFVFLLAEPLIPWMPFSPQLLETSRKADKTVMVDFTANWCLTCQANSRFVIEKKPVLDLVEKNGVVPLLADFTDRSPMVKKTLNELGRNSIPVLAIWPAGGSDDDVIILDDVITQTELLDALKKAGPSSGYPRAGDEKSAAPAP